MARSSGWQILSDALKQNGLDPASEEGRTISTWIKAERAHVSSAPREQELSTVALRASRLYRGFMEEFDACYLRVDPPGEKWVRRDLRTRFGFAPEPAVEAVLERIRDRRYHLLVSFRNRYQPALFGPDTFDRRRLRGYFRRVAWIESRHVPLERMRHLATVSPDVLDDWMLPRTEGEGSDFTHRARLLAEFWGQDRFSRAMRLEGLVSLGMGFLTGDRVLSERCRRYLLARLPAWEERWEKLTIQLSCLLDRLHLIEAKLLNTWHTEERSKLEIDLQTLQGKRARLQLRLQRHLRKLLPKPAEVKRLLDGICPQQLGTVRFQRIGREIALLEERARQSAEDVRAVNPDGPVFKLLEQVTRHLASRPDSPTRRDLTEKERESRQRKQNDWLDSAMQGLASARSLLHRLYPPIDERHEAIVGWLSDLTDLYELGVLDRIGVAGGLHRPPWRLERLLRPGI